MFSATWVKGLESPLPSFIPQIFHEHMYVPDTDLGAGNIAVSKTKPLSSQRLHGNERDRNGLEYEFRVQGNRC